MHTLHSYQVSDIQQIVNTAPVCVIKSGPRWVTAACFFPRFLFFLPLPPPGSPFRRSPILPAPSAVTPLPVFSRGSSPTTPLLPGADEDDDGEGFPASVVKELSGFSSAKSLSSASCTDSPDNPSNLAKRGEERGARTRNRHERKKRRFRKEKNEGEKQILQQQCGTTLESSWFCSRHTVTKLPPAYVKN